MHPHHVLHYVHILVLMVSIIFFHKYILGVVKKNFIIGKLKIIQSTEIRHRRLKSKKLNS